jgi:hypothetical protein
VSSPRRLGEPIELPWWILPLGFPPALCLLLGLVLPAPLSGRLLVVIASALLLWTMVRVARRVESRNMQSVWISAGYALWFFAMLIWAVEVGR